MRLRVELSSSDVLHYAEERQMFRISNGQIRRPDVLLFSSCVNKRDEINVNIPIDVPMFALFGNGCAIFI
jgi:hypothetical protein